MKNEDNKNSGLFGKSVYKEIVYIPSIKDLKIIVSFIENFFDNREQAISLLENIVIPVDNKNDMNLNFIHKNILFRKYLLKKDFIISPFDNDEEFSLLDKFLLFAHSRLKEENLDTKIEITLRRLVSIMPEGGKYKTVRKMAWVLISNQGISNYYNLAKCFPKLRRLTKATFEARKTIRYIPKIKNVLRTLKKIWKKERYTLKIINQSVEIIPIKNK